jgi:transposase-like protein
LSPASLSRPFPDLEVLHTPRSRPASGGKGKWRILPVGEVQVRVAIETAVHEERRVALGTSPYERREVRRGYRNGVREPTLTGPTGPVVLTLPRATLFRGPDDAKEWTSTIVPRYQRRMPEVNEAVIATYLAGGNIRRIRGALQPLLKAAPSRRAPCRAWWPR